jgi:hypothetical protein
MESLQEVQKEETKIITIVGEKTVDKTIKDPMCSKCPTKKATYFANAWGKEKYLCAKRFKFKNQDIPHDLWFCRKINK